MVGLGDPWKTRVAQPKAKRGLGERSEQEATPQPLHSEKITDMRLKYAQPKRFDRDDRDVRGMPPIRLL